MPAPPELWTLDRPLTIDDLDALPENDGWRYELWDGVLIMSPRPKVWHQLLSGRLLQIIARQLPPGWVVVTEVLIRFGSSSRGLVPDLVVIRAGTVGIEDKSVVPAEVGIAIEVESPSTRLYDRGDKPARYAAGGIPVYLRVEVGKLGAPTLVVHDLRDGGYVETRRTQAGQGAVTIAKPGPITIDAAELGARE